jgi:hypothetical protein
MKPARVEHWWGTKFLQSFSPEIWPHRTTSPRRQESWNGVWICGYSGGLSCAFGLLENGVNFWTGILIYEVSYVLTSRTALLSSFKRVRKICENPLLPSSCLSVHPSVFMELDGFLWNFVFEYFPKICRENWSFITIWQEYRVLRMKTNIHFLSYHRSVHLRMKNVSDKSCR